jgi:hypothetical protein
MGGWMMGWCDENWVCLAPDFGLDSIDVHTGRIGHLRQSSGMRMYCDTKVFVFVKRDGGGGDRQ